MTKILVRWVIASLALFAAAWLLPGITVEGTAWIAYAVMAVILGLINALVRPILKFLTCPFIILTLGLFTLIINGITLLLASRISEWLMPRFSFHVAHFGWAFLGALIVSIVTAILSALVKENDEDK